VFQYAIAIVMLVLAFTISHQLYFVMNEGQGIRKDDTAIIDLSLTRATPEKIKLFTERLNAASTLKDYTYCHSIPGDNAYTIAGLRRNVADIPVVFESNGAVDPNFLSFFNLGLVAGENFKVDSLQRDAVILSEGAIERLGFKDRLEALGTIVLSDQNEQKKVVGIVKDYKLRPLLRSHDYLFYEGHTGVVLTYLDLKDVAHYPTKLAVRFENYSEGMSEVRKIYESVFPGSSFVAYNIDSIVNSQYYNYQMSRNQLVFFLVVTLLIALMGMYAMTSLKIASKTKEVGVRKVLGADLWDIVWFLLNKSIRQLGVAGLMAIPVSYFIIQQYFGDFEEHIQISWYHFAIPFVIFLAVSWFPVASIVVRAARENPVQALKYE
jgi:putative ABC transport system permease protein